MRKTTVKELREKELKILIARNPELSDAHARKLMRSFYRLCGLSWQNLYLENDDSVCNTEYARIQEKRELEWYDRLNEDFRRNYGLNLTYCGCMPSIGLVDTQTGGFTEVIKRHFYER